MTPKDEALRILLASIPAPTAVEEVGLADALGRVLARDVTSDLDMPPFDRSAMDGYAVRSDDVARPPVELDVVEVIRAGELPRRAVAAGECSKIMTGAAVPEGADTVVMVEHAEELATDRVRLLRSAAAGQHVAPQGQDMREGEVVIRAGAPLRPIEIGMLATVGRAKVPVFRVPTVAVVATGDELVAPGDGPPGPGQIRESNGSMLTAQVRALGLGIEVTHLGIVRDDRAAVREMIERGLGHDVLVLSGGVSMGDFDYVHEELKARGLNVRLEKVAIKPGKPLIFGDLRAAGGEPRFVFGLPGNPVSSYVTFELFVRPFLRGLMGRVPPHSLEISSLLEAPVPGRSIPRAQHVPARLRLDGDGTVLARPVEWHGSGDLRGLLDANGFIVVPAGETPPASGLVTVLVNEPDALRPPVRPSRIDA